MLVRTAGTAAARTEPTGSNLPFDFSGQFCFHSALLDDFSEFGAVPLQAREGGLGNTPVSPVRTNGPASVPWSDVRRGVGTIHRPRTIHDEDRQANE